MRDAAVATLLNFIIWDWLDLDRLLERERYGAYDRTAIDAVVAVAARFSDDFLGRHARSMDTEPPRLDETGAVRVHPSSASALVGLAENGFFATVFADEHGGLQLPQVVHSAILGLNMAGCVGTASYLLLTVGNARLIVEKGTAAQIAAFAKPQIAGKAMGTMCLSEPHAGSALGAITTLALPDGRDGLGQRFRIRGSKMWISGGDQDVTENIVHLVLAKVPDGTGRIPAGTGGVSLFIVPKLLPDGTPNDIVVTGLNHKLGQRALPNCAMTFGDGRHEPDGAPGAIGWLLGEVGQGLAQMFQMMNDARVAVGMGGAMLALKGYRLSLAYARDRVQGTAGGRSVAIIEHPDVKRMLLAQKAVAEGALSLVLFGARLLDEEQTATDDGERRSAARLLALLTPAIKSWPAEFGQEALHNAIQVLGGAGYTIDHEVEKLYRDNRLNPIHEGTTGIQAIDLVGRKLRKDGGAGFDALALRIAATLKHAADQPELAAQSTGVAGALDRLAKAVRNVVDEDDEAWTLAIATPLLNAFGHVVIAWLWLDQTCVAGRATTVARSAAFDSGRRRAFQYFVDYELPRVGQWLNPVEARSRAVADMAIDEF